MHGHTVYYQSAATSLLCAIHGYNGESVFSIITESQISELQRSCAYEEGDSVGLSWIRYIRTARGYYVKIRATAIFKAPDDNQGWCF